MFIDYLEKIGFFDVDFQSALDLINEIEKEKELEKENDIDYDFWEDDLTESDFDV